MQRVDADALEPGTLYEIIDRGRDPANGFYAKGTFSGPNVDYGGSLVDFRNVTVRGYPGVHATTIFDKLKQDFYLAEQQQPEPPSRGGRRKRRTRRRNAKKSKKHVGRRRRGLSRKH